MHSQATPDHPSAASRALAAPTLLRAAVNLVFAAATIFLTAPTLTLGSWLIAAWFAGTGVSILWTERRSGDHPTLSLGGLEASQRSVGYLSLFGAAVVILLGGELARLALVVSVVLVLIGLPELWIGSTRRKTHPLGRDWLLTGLVAVAAAIGVLLVSYVDVHALLGVVGGAAIISGVFLAIAGLTLRHDGARSVS